MFTKTETDYVVRYVTLAMTHDDGRCGLTKMHLEMVAREAAEWIKDNCGPKNPETVAYYREVAVSKAKSLLGWIKLNNLSVKENLEEGTRLATEGRAEMVEWAKYFKRMGGRK